MQELKLAEEIFDKLKMGKRVTIRLGKRDIQLGELMFVSVKERRVKIVDVTHVTYCKLGNTPFEDLLCDGFKDYADMKKQMSQFYADIKFEDVVTVIRFE